MQISRGPSAATAWLRAGPSSLGQVPEPPNFAGPCSMTCLPPEMSWFSWHLTASCRFSSMTMLGGTGLSRARSRLASADPACWDLIALPHYSKPVQPQLHDAAQPRSKHSTAQYDTVQYRRDTTRPSAPPRIPRIRISRLPRVSRTNLLWQAGRTGRPSRFSNVVPPSPAQPARARRAAQW